jgi:hypothetical protein
MIEWTIRPWEAVIKAISWAYHGLWTRVVYSDVPFFLFWKKGLNGQQGEA